MKKTDWIILLFLIPCTIMDMKTKKIRVWWICLFLTAGVVNHLWIQQDSLWQLILASFVGTGILIIGRIFLGSIGTGDGMAFIVIGVLSGFWDCLILLLVSLAVSSVISLFLLVIKKKDRKYQMPFMPSVCIAYLFRLIGMCGWIL